MKARLDKVMVESGLVPSRQKAQALIIAGRVMVNGHRAEKPGSTIDTESQITIKGDDCPYVSRGGLKLARGLEYFRIDPAGFVCADIGASTGGFTDCLLQHGAEGVVAVDVGYGQLAWSLRQDPRVEVFERTHILRLPEAILTRRFHGVTCDLAFISLTRVLPHLVGLLAPGGWLVALIKPQFEAGKGEVGKGGVVRDPEVRGAAIERVVRLTADLGLRIVGTMDAPIRGPKGNLEAVMVARHDAGSPR